MGEVKENGASGSVLIWLDKWLRLAVGLFSYEISSIHGSSAVGVTMDLTLVGVVIAIVVMVGGSVAYVTHRFGRLEESCRHNDGDIQDIRAQLRDSLGRGQFGGGPFAILLTPPPPMLSETTQAIESKEVLPDAAKIREAIELFRDGKFAEAEEALQDLYEKHPSDPEVVVPLVKSLVRSEVGQRKAYEIISKFELLRPLPPILKRTKVATTEVVKGTSAALELAWQHMRQEPDQPGHYLTLGAYLHAVGEIAEAIEVTKNGLQRAEQVKASGGDQDVEEIIFKLKGNLAYYWADIGLSDFENLARTYAEEAHQIREAPQTKDTLGYVLITYAKSKAEVERGIELCKQAYQAGLPRRFYDKTLARATKRLAIL